MESRGHQSTGRRRRRRSGQVVVVFALALIILLGICVLAIDMGRLFTSKAELQNAVDSAALAAASQLSYRYTDPDWRDRVRAEAKALARMNPVAGNGLSLSDGDFQFGHYDSTTGQFIPEPSATVVDSVRIRGRRTDDSPDGPISLFFAPLFGWDEIEISGVVAVGTKPRRFIMFVLDRSGSMCFDTDGVSCEDYEIPEDGVGYYMQASTSGWYWFPDRFYRPTGAAGWMSRTAWFFARNDSTGQPVTAFLPEHIQSRMEGGHFFNFRPRDYPNTVMSGWLRVPAGTTIYGRYGQGWRYWEADDYYHVIPNDCGYARSTGAVQPLQDSMDAACAFVDLLDSGDDRAGLVTFGWKDSPDQPLTSDFPALKDKLQSYSPCGATAEPDAMKAANDELIDSGQAQGYGHRLMILLTDGYANMLNEVSYDDSTTRTFEFLGKMVTTKIHPTVADAMAAQAVRGRNNGVRIYCVTFGSDVDRALPREIASYTNAAYYHAEDHADLSDIFVDIFYRLPPILTQ